MSRIFGHNLHLLIQLHLFDNINPFFKFSSFQLLFQRDFNEKQKSIVKYINTQMLQYEYVYVTLQYNTTLNKYLRLFYFYKKNFLSGKNGVVLKRQNQNEKIEILHLAPRNFVIYLVSIVELDFLIIILILFTILMFSKNINKNPLFIMLLQ